MQYMCNRILLREKEIMPFAATYMDLEMITLSDLIRKRKTNTVYYLYVESKLWHK